MLYEAYNAIVLCRSGYERPAAFDDIKMAEEMFEALPQLLLQSYVLMFSVFDPTAQNPSTLQIASILWSMRITTAFKTPQTTGGAGAGLAFTCLQLMQLTLRVSVFTVLACLSNGVFMVLYYLASTFAFPRLLKMNTFFVLDTFFVSLINCFLSSALALEYDVNTMDLNHIRTSKS